MKTEMFQPSVRINYCLFKITPNTDRVQQIGDKSDIVLSPLYMRPLSSTSVSFSHFDLFLQNHLVLLRMYIRSEIHHKNKKPEDARCGGIYNIFLPIHYRIIIM